MIKLTERVHPEDLPKIMQGVEESAKTMEMWQLEYRIILPNKVAGLAPAQWLFGHYSSL